MFYKYEVYPEHSVCLHFFSKFLHLPVKLVFHIGVLNFLKLILTLEKLNEFVF